MALGHGGQVLVSGATARLLEGSFDHASMLRPLGEVELRGLRRVEEVHELRYPGLDEEFPPLAVHLPRSQSLPNVTDELIGRDDAVAGATALLSGASLITLTGPGGVGKTRLSIEVGTLAGHRFGDGVWFVPLASVSDASAVPNGVAEVLGVQETAGRSLTESIVGAIAGRDLLLILDNCEHVAARARGFALAIAREAAPVVVLATSREPLAIAGEHVVAVEPLSTTDSPDELAPAAQLFIERAARSDPAFSSIGSLEAIPVVCTRLDGMPLAIELAAARVRGLGLEGLGTHLDHRFRLLRDRGAVDSRHQTLLATVQWSFDLLDEWLRELFCRAVCSPAGSRWTPPKRCWPSGPRLDRRRRRPRRAGRQIDAADRGDPIWPQVPDVGTMRQTAPTPSIPPASGPHATGSSATTRGPVHRRRSGAQWPRCGRRNSAARSEFDNIREAVRLASAAGSATTPQRSLWLCTTSACRPSTQSRSPGHSNSSNGCRAITPSMASS